MTGIVPLHAWARAEMFEMRPSGNCRYWGKRVRLLEEDEYDGGDVCVSGTCFKWLLTCSAQIGELQTADRTKPIWAWLLTADRQA